MLREALVQSCFCGNYKLTINEVAFTETCPLPRADELFAKFSGGKFFSKLDLSSAYIQLPLDDEAKEGQCNLEEVL